MMTKWKKEAARLIAGALANLSVVGFGLAIYENKFVSLVAGMVSILMAVYLIWRIEK
jgi:hypothetical protein